MVHSLKRTHYDTDEMRQWIAEHAKCTKAQVRFSSLAFNLRGALAKASERDALTIGITKGDLKVYSVAVLEKGFETYLFSRRNTGIGEHRG